MFSEQYKFLIHVTKAGGSTGICAGKEVMKKKDRKERRKNLYILERSYKTERRKQ